MSVEIMHSKPELAPSLRMAVESNMCIQLHVDDGTSEGGISIPLKDILSGTSTVGPHESLRNVALVALFRYTSKNGTVPQYAKKNFESIFTYKVDGEVHRQCMANDEEMRQVLEKACTDHLMDDNEDTILDIYCTFRNKKYKESDRMKKIRAGASIAADNVMKTLKNWVEKAVEMLKNEEHEYVVVNEDKGKNSLSADDWANRFVSILFSPEEMRAQQKKDRCFNVKNTLDSIALDAVEGFTRIFDLVDEVVAHHQLSHATRAERWESMKPTHNVVMEKKDVEDCVDIDQGVEIVFDPESRSKPEEEWKVFSHGINSEDDDEDDLSFSDDDAVLLESPVNDSFSINSDDIVSIGSDDTVAADNCEVSVTFDKCEVSDSDDDSWAMLDDE